MRFYHLQELEICLTRKNSRSWFMDNFPNDNYEQYTSEANCQWFVLRDITRPNAKLPGYKLLEKEEVTFFTPMHDVIKDKNGKKNRIEVPIIRNLLFVYACKNHLDMITSKHPTLQYRYVYGHKTNDPMVVPKDEMDRFIYAVKSSLSEPIYYAIEDITADKYGKQIRIIGGNLNGYSGRLLKMQGSKTKRMLVELKGLFYAGVEVEAEYIQFI